MLTWRAPCAGSPAAQMAEAAALLRFSSAHTASDAHKAAFSADVRSAVRGRPAAPPPCCAGMHACMRVPEGEQLTCVGRLREQVRSSLDSSQGGNGASRQGSLCLPDAEGGDAVSPSAAQVRMHAGVLQASL